MLLESAVDTTDIEAPASTSESILHNIENGSEMNNVLNIDTELYKMIPQESRDVLERIAEEMDEVNQKIKRASTSNCPRFICCGSTNVSRIAEWSEKAAQRIREVPVVSDEMSEEEKKDVMEAVKKASGYAQKAAKELREADRYSRKSRICRCSTIDCWMCQLILKQGGEILLWIIGIFLLLCIAIMIPKLTWYVVFEL